MALFTSKADANLPLLTQFYQLEVPLPDDEVVSKDIIHAWWKAWKLQGIHDAEVGSKTGMPYRLARMGNSNPEISPGRWRLGNLLVKVLPDGSGVVLDASYGNRLMADLKLSGVGELREWVDVRFPKAGEGLPREWDELGRLHGLMVSLMKCAVDLQQPTAEEIESLNLMIREVMKPEEAKWEIKSAAEIRWLVIHQEVPGLSPFRRIVHREIIGDFLAMYGSLKRCGECGSIYVEQKNEQVYCSTRCRARAGQRRRYAELMEGYQPLVKSRVTLRKT